MTDETQPTKAVEPVKAPVEAEPAKAEPKESDEVTLVADLPFFISAYEVPREDGSRLVFNQNGTAVPADEADELIENASRDGVSLVRKAD